jgi:hypothetical protein
VIVLPVRIAFSISAAQNSQIQNPVLTLPVYGIFENAASKQQKAITAN